MITISPGHWLPGTGARDLIDEVTEARKVVNRVVEILRSHGITVHHIEDNISKNQQQNLNYLVTQHNKTNRKLDVSVHFNSSASRTDRGLGVEVLYYDQKDLAAKVSKAISDASGLINRGAKERKELAFLRNTNKPAILIEVCFVNSTVDVAIYRRDFEKICRAIAEKLAEYVGHPLKLLPTVVDGNKEELTMKQYEELKKLIEAQNKRIAELENQLGLKERPVLDTHKTAWQWAEKEGLMNGKNPNRPVSREQLATIMYRQANKNK